MEKPLPGSVPEGCTSSFKRHLTFFLVYSSCLSGLYFLIVILLLEPKNTQRSPKMSGSVGRQTDGEAQSKGEGGVFKWEGTKQLLAQWQLPPPGQTPPLQWHFPLSHQATTSSPNHTSPRMEAPSSAGKGTGCAFLPHQVSRSTFDVSQGHYQG